MKTKSLVILYILTPAFVLTRPDSLSAARRRIRTASSAVTPVDASRHQKENDRIMADLKKRNGDVGLLLAGDSITALWPAKGPKSYSAACVSMPSNRGWMS